MLQQTFQPQEDSEKTISKLKEIRNNLFSVKDINFGWKHYYSISYMKKYPEIQKEINLNENHLNLIVNNFKEWCSVQTCLTFQDEEGSLNYFLASKRGNKPYEYYLNRNLDNQLGFMKNPNFNKLILRNKKGFRNKKISNVCFLTLTCNPAKYNNSRTTAWLNFEHDYNNFSNAFRKKFGKCWIMKAVESSKKGYPHIHLLIITEKEFDVYKPKLRKCLNKKCNRYFNTTSKRYFVICPHCNSKTPHPYRMNVKKEIENYWTSFIDAKTPDSSEMKKGSCADFVKDYILKDMLKSYVCSDKRNHQNYLSLALGWLFGKRCYSISKMDLKLDLMTDTSLIQTQIKDISETNLKKRFVFLGLTDFKSINEKPPPFPHQILKTDKNFEYYLNLVYGLKKKNQFYVQEKPQKKDIFYFGDIENFKEEIENKKRKDFFNIKNLKKFAIIKTNDSRLPELKDFECVNLKDMKIKLFTGRTLFEFKQGQKKMRRLSGLNKDNFDSEDRIRLAITDRC